MTMVERVARAIQSLSGVGPEWDGLPEPGRALCRGFARAAIKAMREPTDGFLEIASHLDKSTDAEKWWADLVDAALTE